jgi:hypothetical protein
VLTTYGRSSGFCIDPIEKKPLNGDAAEVDAVQSASTFSDEKGNARQIGWEWPLRFRVTANPLARISHSNGRIGPAISESYCAPMALAGHQVRKYCNCFAKNVQPIRKGMSRISRSSGP